MLNPIRYLKGPGPTVCMQCHHDKIDWVNYETWAEVYRREVADGGCGGERIKA